MCCATRRRKRRRSAAAAAAAAVASALLFRAITCAECAAAAAAAQATRVNRQQQRLVPGNHTRNAAVLVSSSRYWHNYRHVSNVLSIYDLLKRGGLSDEDIILMIADDLPCDARNPHMNAIYPENAQAGAGKSVYDADVEIDYRGTDVSVENFLRVLVGKHEDGEAPSRMLNLTPDTNLLIMLTGHGGDNFFKHLDGEELMTEDLKNSFQQMHKLGRYHEILFVADTCQAFTLNPTDPAILPDAAALPNVMTVASSLKDQNSYAHHSDPEIGQSVVDRYTFNFVSNVNKLASRRKGSAVDESSVFCDIFLAGTSVKAGWVDAMPRRLLGADVGWTDRGCRRQMSSIPLSDFFCDKQTHGIGSIGIEDMLLQSNTGPGSAHNSTHIAAIMRSQL